MKKLYGLLGEKLTHSISPLIHSEIFSELKLDGCYKLFEVKKEKLEDAFREFKESDMKGINVTIPYKVDVMKFLDEISSEAESIGAVNTIHFKERKLYGYNTDYHGFGMMLKRNNIAVNNKTAVILGTGGASKAVIKYLCDNNVKDIIMVSRNPDQTGKFYKDLKAISYSELDNYKQGDMIINCTPCGMYPNIEASPINIENISKFQAAVDLIYNPQETIFLKYAKDSGIKAVNGLYMLVGQAVKAEEIWNDTVIDGEIIDKIYEKVKAQF